MKRPRNGSDVRQVVSALQHMMRDAALLFSKLALVIGALSGMIKLLTTELHSIEPCTRDLGSRCTDRPAVEKPSACSGAAESARCNEHLDAFRATQPKCWADRASCRIGTLDEEPAASEREYCP